MTQYEWVLVARPIGENDEGTKTRLEKVKKHFPSGLLDNLPIDFLERCQFSEDPEFPDCIIFTYTDGRVPTRPEYGQPSYPTYKGVAGKKVSIMGAPHGGKIGKGTVVVQTCRNVFCVNQQHLKLTGEVVDNGRKAADAYLANRSQGVAP